MKRNALALALVAIVGLGFVNAVPVKDEPVRDTTDQKASLAMMDTTETGSYLAMMDTTETGSYLAMMDTTETGSYLAMMDEPVRDTTDNGTKE